jgi:hypothetical protein
MPLGATPSRWCVCQFHHFRTLNCFIFNCLLDTPLRASGQRIHFCYHFLHPAGGKKLAAPQIASGQRSCGLHSPEGWAERIVVLMLSCPAVYCNLHGLVS